MTPLVLQRGKATIRVRKGLSVRFSAYTSLEVLLKVLQVVRFVALAARRRKAVAPQALLL